MVKPGCLQFILVYYLLHVGQFLLLSVPLVKVSRLLLFGHLTTRRERRYHLGQYWPRNKGVKNVFPTVATLKTIAIMTGDEKVLLPRETRSEARAGLWLRCM